jgi:hypothetical protein
MSKVLGISGFGLNDCASTSQFMCCSGNFFLSDAVLPFRSMGRILTGLEAEDARIHTGLHWPFDARIEPGSPLRRAPIPYVWRALVGAGDRTVNWNAGNNVHIPLSRILARHLWDVTHFCSSEEIKVADIMSVAAIPDHLDEFGQEQLLREMKALGWKDPHLIWRPVAAALAWLNEVEGDFSRHLANKNPDSHIHVIYLGPDAFEFSTFQLRVREHNNHFYVLPRRDRPTEAPLPFTGMDWAGQLIHEIFEDIDPDSFWQAFTNFSEVWEAIAGRSFKASDLPRPWSRQGKWELWNPDKDLMGIAPEIQVSQCENLRNLVKTSCELNDEKIDFQGTVKEYLLECIHNISNNYPNGKLQGMIVCGPLSPKKMPEWLTTEMAVLKNKGLYIQEDFTTPQIGCLWMPGEKDDPIARGAAIYGERILEGVPAYLDTLPQLAMLAHGKGRYIWVPLLDAQEVLGGEEYSDNIADLFQLKASQKRLHAYLFKGSREKAPEEPPDPSDPRYLPLQEVSPCEARLIRSIIRQMNNLEQFEKTSFFQKDTAEARYGRSFANAYFNQEKNQKQTESKDSNASMSKPFRKAIFEFPSGPDRDELIDVSVRIRPASGLARVELNPKDASFLEGERVRLNYERMRRTENLPRRSRGWPTIQELVADPNDWALKKQRTLVEKFENTRVTDQQYLAIIDDIRDEVLKKATQIYYANKESYVKFIDQNGRACTPDGNDIIKKVVEKFDLDFNAANDEDGLTERILTRASWLYTSTPSNIINYIGHVLADKLNVKRWNDLIYAAGRSFSEYRDFQLLFKAIESEIKHRESLKKAQRSSLNVFPIQCQRAICFVLMYRRESEKSLSCETASFFAIQALKRLKNEEEKKNFNITYFQLIRLLLYLLRCRRSKPQCFSPSDESQIRPFLEAIRSMQKARNILQREHNRAKSLKVDQILNGFEKYLYYEGTEETLVELNKLAGDT